MRFFVLPTATYPRAGDASGIYLTSDDWNDYWDFETLYHATFVSDEGHLIPIGATKIGQFEMKTTKPTLPQDFEQLGDSFFSLGQDEAFYENLTVTGEVFREQVLIALRDIAYDIELYDRAKSEEVTRVSLLRSVSRVAAENKLRQLARGDTPLTGYSFRYHVSERTTAEPREMIFEVNPSSYPPSNVHVVIGRNGVGKTRLLQFMARALVGGDTDTRYGRFTNLAESEVESTALFANVVSVTFSAFDELAPIAEDDFGEAKDRMTKVAYSYIGLRYPPNPDSTGPRNQAPKDPLELGEDFASSAAKCANGERSVRWHRALRTLEADPIFKAAGISLLIEADTVGEEGLIFREVSSELFGALSTGHKIVLLTITRLVETVDERSIVLFDEPEAHLHPPLLSALIRALSELLVSRNGVAIVATHSPVVLQEVPQSCVSILRRRGTSVIVERPGLETFGENAGILTREVFGLEVTQSGFHRLLSNEVDRGLSYDDIEEKLEGQIGGEGRAIVRNLIALRDQAER